MRRTTIFLLAFTFAVVASSLFGYDFKRCTNFEDAWKASCRVVTPNAMGTGTFIGYDSDKDKCVFLTNYHVVTNNTNVRLDFWTNGYLQSVKAKVVKRFYNQNPLQDFALAEVEPSDLAAINPPWVALGGRDAAPDENSIIISSGCPDGRFAQAWQGKIVGNYSGATILFQPPPVPGQSGSAIISKVGDELFVTGILTWLIGAKGQDSSKGGAIPVSNLWEAMESRQRSAVEPNKATKSLIPPNATECAAKDPYVIEFSQDNCPPCVQAKKDVAKLKQAGIQVLSYNVSTSEEGQDLAKNYKILGTPTFIICSQDGEEIGRAIGPGKAGSIIQKINSYKAEQEEIEEEPVVPLEPSNGTKDVIDSITSDWFIYGAEDEEEKDPYAFRNREPVYENDDSYLDAGFFEDSDARWRRRGQGNSEAEPEKPREKIIPRQQEDPPTIDENKLGDRIRGKLNESIDRKLGLALSQFERKFDEKTGALASLWKKRIVEWYDSIKVTLWSFIILAFILFSVISNVIAHYVIKGINWYFSPEEENEEEISEKIEENSENEVKK